MIDMNFSDFLVLHVMVNSFEAVSMLRGTSSQLIKSIKNEYSSIAFLFDVLSNPWTKKMTSILIQLGIVIVLKQENGWHLAIQGKTSIQFGGGSNVSERRVAEENRNTIKKSAGTAA